MRHFIWIAVYVVGCGKVVDTQNPDGGSRSDGGSGSDSDDFTLTADPNQLAIPITKSATITLAVARSGNVSDVALTVSTLPAGITVTFANNPIPSAATVTTATITLTPGTSAGANDIVIVGSAAGLDRTATVSVTATTMTVTGTVRGGRSGVTVRIPGKPAVVSNALGAFTFTDVTPPYDIYTVANGLRAPTVTYYEKLTRPDPVVDAASSSLTFTSLSSATVSGNKGGTGDFVSPMVYSWSEGGESSTIGSSYSIAARWSPASSTKTGTVYGLQWTTATNGAPNAFLGFAQTATTLVAGGTASSINLKFEPVTTGTLTGTIKAVGFPTPTLTLEQQLGNNAHTMWQATTTAVSARIPLIAAGKAALHATTTAGGSTISFVHPALGASTDVSFDLPAPATQIAPLSGAAGITNNTTFDLSLPTGVVHTLNVSTEGTVKAAYRIITTRNALKIPSVPELPLPPGQSFAWFVEGFGPAASVDDGATATALEPVSSRDFVGGRHFQTTSPTRTFTSQ